MYGQFIRDMPEGTDKEKFSLWMRKCELKMPTKALICSAQEQTMSNTTLIKVLIHLLVECVVRQANQLLMS